MTTAGEADSCSTMIGETFRNGSLTAVSVISGFSLTFLTRWAALPGPWHASDFVAIAGIVLGIACQILTLTMLLSIKCLQRTEYERSIRLFLIGLTFVALGVACALIADIAGHGQRVLTG